MNVKVAMQNPLKQGLKLTDEITNTTVIDGRNAKSTKTRIETYFLLILRVRFLSRNAKSTKTRIETHNLVCGSFWCQWSQCKIH